MRGVAFSDRLISILAYFTFGIFSLIWIIFANIKKYRITPFLNFNLYQAIFLSVALSALSLIYSIAINILAVVPFVNTLARNFDLFFNQTPIYFGCTLSGLIVSILLIYLSVLSFMGRRPYIPLISNMINTNFGG